MILIWRSQCDCDVRCRQFQRICRSLKNPYLAIGCLKCGIFVQFIENGPLLFRYLFSLQKCNNLMCQVVTLL